MIEPIQIGNTLYMISTTHRVVAHEIVEGKTICVADTCTIQDYSGNTVSSEARKTLGIPSSQKILDQCKSLATDLSQRMTNSGATKDQYGHQVAPGVDTKEPD